MSSDNSDSLNSKRARSFKKKYGNQADSSSKFKYSISSDAKLTESLNRLKTYTKVNLQDNSIDKDERDLADSKSSTMQRTLLNILDVENDSSMIFKDKKEQTLQFSSLLGQIATKNFHRDPFSSRLSSSTSFLKDTDIEYPLNENQPSSPSCINKIDVIEIQCKYNVVEDETLVNYCFDPPDDSSPKINSRLSVEKCFPINIESQIQRYMNKNECNCSFEEISSFDRGTSYCQYHAHELFQKCEICSRKPATFLCLHTLKGFCPLHVEDNYNKNNKFFLYLNILDIANCPGKVFWCEKCKAFSSKHTDIYSALTEQIMYTKGTYLNEAIRDILIVHNHVQLPPLKSLAHFYPCVNEKCYGDCKFCERKNLHLKTICSTAQGWRSTQEDSETIFAITVPLFKDHEPVSMVVLCVFDGHGGDAVSILASSLIKNILYKSLKKVNGCIIKDFPVDFSIIETFFTALFEDAFARLDEQIYNTMEGKSGKFDYVGSTACVVCLSNFFIVCANLGDSGAAIYHFKNKEIVELSHQHRITNEFEIERILNSGHTIVNGRIDEALAVPRALGDYHFKKEFRDTDSLSFDNNILKENDFSGKDRIRQCEYVIKFSSHNQAVVCIPTVKVFNCPPAFYNGFDVLLNSTNTSSLDNNNGESCNNKEENFKEEGKDDDIISEACEDDLKIPCGLIVACDGLWDTLSNTQIGIILSNQDKNILEELKEKVKNEIVPASIPLDLFAKCLALYSQCIAPTNNEAKVGVDNVSFILVEPCNNNCSNIKNHSFKNEP